MASSMSGLFLGLLPCPHIFWLCLIYTVAYFVIFAHEA